MKLSVCTISFRHQLISLEEIATWAKAKQFDAIELWGAHAKNLVDMPDCDREYNRDWLSAQNLSVSMVSDYLPLDGDLDKAVASTQLLCQLTQSWGAKKLRTFSGNKPSADVSAPERQAMTQRLKQLCQIVADHGLQLVVETHPNTLADTLESTLQLIDEVDHPALRINFDVIHVWEMGSDPIKALKSLQPLIVHLHLKNISDKKLLNVFAPGNIYAPAGSREGITPLFEGAYDFKEFLRVVMSQSQLPWQDMDASLEWFGPKVLSTLASDSRELIALQADYANLLTPSNAVVSPA